MITHQVWLKLVEWAPTSCNGVDLALSLGNSQTVCVQMTMSHSLGSCVSAVVFLSVAPPLSWPEGPSQRHSAVSSLLMGTLHNTGRSDCQHLLCECALGRAPGGLLTVNAVCACSCALHDLWYLHRGIMHSTLCRLKECAVFDHSQLPWRTTWSEFELTTGAASAHSKHVLGGTRTMHALVCVGVSGCCWDHTHTHYHTHCPHPHAHRLCY